VTVISPDGTSTVATHTNGPAETVAAIVTSLQGQLTAIAGLTAADNVTEVSCAADTPGDLFDYQQLTGGLEVLDVTLDPGIATDLAAIRLEDPDWYGLVLDSNSEAEVLATAAWAEAQTVLFGANSADAGVLYSVVTTDVASDLQTSAFARTFIIWSGSVLSYAAAAWLGKQLPTDPGSTTWKFKTLAGVAVDNLNANQVSAADAKDCNHYTRVAGVNITREGVTSANEFIDITRYIDFLTARLQENIFALLVNQPKLPYTDASVDLILGEIRAQLRRGIPLAIVEGSIVTSAPAVEDISSQDRANRLLPDVTFQARLAGAIHNIVINGVLTV
jgi:hypothetical protein